jgi:hypothetical protein
VNNVDYETTGTIPTADENGNLALDEGVKLLMSGPTETQNFRLKMPGNGSMTVEVFAPYDANKKTFAKWLKDNGYSHIDPGQFNYTNIAQ